MRRLAESAFRATLDVAAGRTPPYIVNPQVLAALHATGASASGH